MKIDVKREDVVINKGIIFKKAYTFYKYTVTADISEEEWLGIGRFLDQNMEWEFPTGEFAQVGHVREFDRNQDRMSLVYKDIMKARKKGKADWNVYKFLPRQFASKQLAEDWFQGVVEKWKVLKGIIDEEAEADELEENTSIEI